MATDPSFLKRLGQPLISISEQYLAFKRRCSGTVKIINNDKTVQWEGTIRPTALSRQYHIVIRYTLSKCPVCVVKGPCLSKLAEGRQIPHIYQNQTGIKGTQLCLYLPVVKKKNRVSEWQPTMYLVDTILPWASIWLFYFEIWISSDTWFGGGIEHDAVEDSRR
ncbi:hypothetical protein [Pseudoalteromonas galatheae]|uniref:hypothetical protein n=1 Tax=Pseudoalteromonas galatheae TaxID=579562 RepID=UPI0030D41602